MKHIYSIKKARSGQPRRVRGRPADPELVEMKSEWPTTCALNHRYYRQVRHLWYLHLNKVHNHHL